MKEQKNKQIGENREKKKKKKKKKTGRKERIRKN